MTPAHRVELTLSEDGRLCLEQLPFRAGQAVEVIVLLAPQQEPTEHPLRGTVLRYDGPTEPVVEEEWDAAR